jgi:hypothetical protein
MNSVVSHRRIVQEPWRKAMKVFSVVGLGLIALSFNGCAADWVKQNQGDVIMRIVGFTPADPLQSDVLSDEGSIDNDEISVNVAVRFKNPNLPVPSVPNAVFLERYTIEYVRSDGRAVQGVDVPFALTGNLTAVIDVASSGSVGVPIEIVRVQQKLEPPLRNLRNLRGSIAISCFANVTVYGRTTEGSVVSASGSLQVDFADWAG